MKKKREKRKKLFTFWQRHLYVENWEIKRVVGTLTCFKFTFIYELLINLEIQLKIKKKKHVVNKKPSCIKKKKKK